MGKYMTFSFDIAKQFPRFVLDFLFHSMTLDTIAYESPLGIKYESLNII